ncbi:MAG: hypothetical protein IPN92_15465 [Chromatiaceae bacterium]|nr:hypothetical protein [Chromatiaceae bacterium]
MSNDTRTGTRSASGDRVEPLAELGLPLEELVRRGARDILQRAIEAEVEQLLETLAAVLLTDGRRAVVRNGYLPAREILTPVGPVEVQVPKVRDRSGSEDRGALLAFFAFPAEHGVPLRTTNPIESTFATVRQRTRRTKNGVTRATFLGLAFKLSEEAAKTWRRIRAPEKVAELLGGARYADGIPVSDDPPETQEEQREAA